MYEPLVRRDRNLKLEPALATEWTNVNPTTWRFKLRRGVKFHDGTPLTVEDVLFSFQRAVAPGSDLAAQLSEVKEVKKIGDDSIDFITEGPAPDTALWRWRHDGGIAPILFSNGSRGGGSFVSDIDACRVSAFSTCS
jgi:ABC-type transport system substrate-binding protein